MFLIKTFYYQQVRLHNDYTLNVQKKMEWNVYKHSIFAVERDREKISEFFFMILTSSVVYKKKSCMRRHSMIQTNNMRFVHWVCHMKVMTILFLMKTKVEMCALTLIEI